MAVNTVNTKEYTCERCGWKWVRRINGRDLEDEPAKCAKCKTNLWNRPRRNDMSYAAFLKVKFPSVYLDSKSEEKLMEAKKNFLYLFYNRPPTERYSPHGEEAEDEMKMTAYTIEEELSLLSRHRHLN